MLTFVSAELIMMGILQPLGVTMVQSLPAAITLPMIRVRRVPGQARTMIDDPAHVEVLSFTATYEDGLALSENIANTVRWAYATAAPLPGGQFITVDATEAILPPTEMPWPDSDVRVFQATYVVTTRGKQL